MPDDKTPTLPPSEPPSDTSNDFYHYGERAQAALLDMVKNVLRQVAKEGLIGEHHFFLTYYTQSEGVVLPDKLRAAHPEEITIVLQNQFEDLEVEEDVFRVTLAFDNQAERLVVPFKTLSKFYDPSVAFGLMFDVEPPFTPTPDDDLNDETGLTEGEQKTALKPDGETGEVVSLDSFRDK